ncbi:MAG TPA: glycosyltransferase family 2 protein [Thermoanaerobaculia bacterium]|jgi:glycosyltransferase involved in cell wall biosynthesis|nr:glycosyltransferase family 2 protein [Thermoanaerobaculia bacterium]
MTERVIVIIPALNAERSVGVVVRDCKAVVKDVLVVDDGSADRTAEVAREAGAQVVSHSVNRGKGAALKTGFAYALEHGFEAVVTLDADGQHLASEIPKFLAAREETGADLIIGGRAHLFGQMLPRRRFANRFSARCIAFASHTDVTDSQSGFRLYSAQLLRAIRLRSDGFDLESEVIVQAGQRRFKILSIPIDLGFVDGQSTSHYKPLMDTIRIAWTVIRARYFWR